MLNPECFQERSMFARSGGSSLSLSRKVMTRAGAAVSEAQQMIALLSSVWINGIEKQGAPFSYGHGIELAEAVASPDPNF
jgi:hypothetical protein